MKTFPFLPFENEYRDSSRKSPENVTFFFSSQVNMHRYFYEVKISAYLKDLNGILTSQALGQGCWNEHLLPAGHEMLKTLGTSIFLQIGFSTEVKHISTIFLQDSSDPCPGFTNFYTHHVMGIYFQDTTPSNLCDTNCLSITLQPQVSLE